MEIKYLKLLQDNPYEYPAADENNRYPIVSLSITEINDLETSFNNGLAFPLAVRELLYLAGKRCYALEYGYQGSIQKMQQDVRKFMQEWNRELTRPFLVIDVYNILDQFLFVFLEEGDDPVVYRAEYDPNHLPEGQWYEAMQPNLSTFINKKVQYVKAGGSAF
ncbi:hypothetical protein [Sphingobacterium yanglingense]|uniref:SUKH superfamily protein n=1 Tax=Sphingobacterium yanglingense TaxID=1437280 RepID=A0A4R6WCX6_9SPHI|nr:hypothetical protein [Sphingobacterium yanglingense]TDQ77458.1 hypothetical protein CLV99_2865 [Sphingobacterium yanglingense]